MVSLEHALPVEQWRQVLMYVDPGDLCNVVLTSRHINRVASSPELWTGMKVNKEKVQENGLAELYTIVRFNRIKELDLSRVGFSPQELEHLLTDIPESPLETLNLKCVNLSGVPYDLLAGAVKGLRTVNLSCTEMTYKHCCEVLEASLSSNTLIDLNLGHVNLSGVPADLLARTVSRLETATLFGTELTTQQCCHLTYVNLSRVPSDLLARAVCRLRTVNLFGSEMTTEQCICFLKTSLSSNTLVDINLSSVILSEVPAELLARAVSRLPTSKLVNTKLSSEQCVAVLNAILSSPTVQHVDLRCNKLCCKVPKKLLEECQKCGFISFLYTQYTER